MTNEFMHQRHATYATPAQVISDLIKDATGQEVYEHEQIVSGYANEVHCVRTRQGKEFIVRIRQHGELSFGEEAWAMARCRDAGAPVPEVYLVTTITVADQPREIMVLQQVPGRALSEIEVTLTQPERQHIFAQVGAALSAIHSVHADGFYRMHADGSWDFPDWDSFVHAMLRDRAADVPVLVQVGLSEAEVGELLQLLSTMHSHTCIQPVLCHGDLAMEHLFFDDHLNLTGIIDFGQAQGGSPVLDFAMFLMYHPEVDLASLQHGYQNKALFDETFMLQLLAQQAQVEVSYLGHDLREGNTDSTALALQGVRRTLHAWRRFQSGAT